MTDGPFKNAKVSTRMKDYGEVLARQASGIDECSDFLCHSMLGDANLKSLFPIVRALLAYAEGCKTAPDLLPELKIASIFERCNDTSPTIANLERQVMANMGAKMAPDTAVTSGVRSLVQELLESSQNRVNEELISSRERQDISHAKFEQCIERNGKAARNVDQEKVFNAVISNDRNAFKSAVSKKTGLYEGPDL